MATLISGKEIGEKVKQEVKERAEAFQAQHGRAPGLVVILCSDDPASARYVRSKEKAAESLGIAGRVHRLGAEVTQPELEALVRQLNEDEKVDGILVQLPLFKHLQEQPILEMIRADKDVDGFHAQNVGGLWSGTGGLVPCTAKGCVRLLEEAGVEFSGRRAVVLGRSNLVGKPVAALLLERNATVTIAHSRTPNTPELCSEADIVIAAVGRARMVKASWIKSGAAVIDVGINQDQDGKLCGDVDFDDVEPVAGVITKVPGGVGPMTIAMLMSNTLDAAEARANKPR